ncbi:MAG: hypothetical protein J5598_03740 [Clostridia bacterium]|nr:hypothetical protein [Clostridia bacterium]
MIEKAKKVALVGERTALKNVIDTLKATGNFQITFHKSSTNPLSNEDADLKKQYTNELNRVSGVLNYLKANNQAVNITYHNLKNVTKKQKQIENLLTEFEQAKIDATNLQTQINLNQNSIQALQKFRDLPVPAHLLKSTQNAFVLAGLISAADFTRFTNDIDTKDFIYETYPTTNKSLVVVMTGEIENQPIAETILDYNFTPFPSYYEFERTPLAQIDYLSQENLSLTNELTKQAQKYQPTAEQVELLKVYHDYLLNEIDTLEILGSTIQTKLCFVVHGWIPARIANEFTTLIRETDKNIVVTIQDATETDTPPALVHNTPLIAPYNSITMMYGAPGRNDIDPNPFVAFFYFLFFGAMFGDLGYGLLLSVITAVILLVKRPQGGTRQLIALFCMGGVSAALWGLLFNSFFGLNLPTFMMNRTIIDPLGNDATLFFALSLYLGVIQIMVGNLLNFINQLRLQQHVVAWCKGLPNFVMFVGLTLAFPSLIQKIIPLDYAAVNWFHPLMVPGLIVTLVGFAGVVLGNGIGHRIGGYMLGMFSGAYKLVNYFSDILSYARLFGVGLVGCVIAYVTNFLCGMFAGAGFIGIIFGGIVAILFHALNIALSLLSAYIHNARLQFVEFFGKFYEGTGTPFVPMASKLRYARIQNDTRK